MLECKYIHGDGQHRVEDTDTQGPRLLPPKSSVRIEYVHGEKAQTPGQAATHYIALYANKPPPGLHLYQRSGGNSTD